MPLKTPETETIPSELRRLFPRAMANNGMDLEKPEILRKAVNQACAHELLYRQHDAGDERLRLTRQTERRLLNVTFTEGLEAVAMRVSNNPFARIIEDSRSVGHGEHPMLEQQLAITIHRNITRDDPNALQELFAEHLKDLSTYLDDHALPPAAFLVTCAVFVAHVRRRNHSQNFRT